MLLEALQDELWCDVHIRQLRAAHQPAAAEPPLGQSLVAGRLAPRPTSCLLAHWNWPRLAAWLPGTVIPLWRRYDHTTLSDRFTEVAAYQTLVPQADLLGRPLHALWPVMSRTQDQRRNAIQCTRAVQNKTAAESTRPDPTCGSEWQQMKREATRRLTTLQRARARPQALQVSLPLLRA